MKRFNFKPLLVLLGFLCFVVSQELYTVDDWRIYFMRSPRAGADFFWDLSYIALDSAECLASRLLSLTFWLLLVATMVLKQHVLLPRLEQHYKKTHAVRAQRRKRRLRDTLNDPVLALNLEEQLLRRWDIQGDRTKMLEAMQQIREMSEDTADAGEDSEKGGATTKGQEKYEAANAIFYGTIFASILLFSIANTMVYSEGISGGGGERLQAMSVSYATATTHAIPRVSRQIHLSEGSNTRQIHRRRLSESWNSDVCGGWGPLLFMVFFCCIHILHSYKLVRDATQRPKRSVPPKGMEDKLLRPKSDLEQPLLPASDKVDSGAL